MIAGNRGYWYRATLSVPATHPALPGHFPGAPVVPGVVLLDWVLQVAEERLKEPIRTSGLPQVKFHAPLLPQHPADFVLRLEADRLSFQILRDGVLIAQGSFHLERQSA